MLNYQAKYSIKLISTIILIILLNISNSFAINDIIQEILQQKLKNKSNTAQQFLYKYYAVFKRQKLPQDLKDLPHGRCATTVIKQLRNEAKKYKSLLQTDDNLKFLSSNILSKPTDYSLDKSYSTTHFVVWYTETGTNAVTAGDTNTNNIPDFVEDAGIYAEYSYNYFVSTLGYLLPPTTTNYPKTYIMIMDISAYGWTDYGRYADDTTGDTSQIAIHNTFDFVRSNDDPEGKIKGAEKVTIAHELFHAIKAVYDWEEDYPYYWWDEATSTWAEDILYPQVNDYLGYLPNWFASPQTSLTTFNGWHEYGTSIFAKFLTENHQYSTYNFGNKIIKESWEEAAKVPNGGSSLQNLKTIFSTKYNTTLRDVFLDFLAANYLKDYEDGTNSKFPSITTTDSAVTDVVLTSDSVNSLASKYYGLTSPNTNNYNFIFDGSENVLFSLVLIKEGTNYDISKSNLPEATNQWVLSLAGLNQIYNKAIVIAANTSDSGTGDYKYYVSTSTNMIPQPVTNLSITAGISSLTLNWTEPNDNNVILYTIYRSTQSSAGFTLLDTAQVGTTSYTDKNLSSITTYRYMVCSKNINDIENCSAEVSGTPLTDNNAVEVKLPGSGIFPNPAKGKVYFQMQTSATPASLKISVYNNKGILVSQTNDFAPLAKMSGSKYQSSMDFTDILPNGIYFFKVEITYPTQTIVKSGKMVILK